MVVWKELFVVCDRYFNNLIDFYRYWNLVNLDIKIELVIKYLR